MLEPKRIDIGDRTFKFGIRIVKLVISLPKNTAGFKIGEQVLRSGTSIGANIEEAQNSGSKKEFIHSLTIALKEARETNYWLRMIGETDLVKKDRLENLINEDRELIKILITIVKRSKIKN